MTCPGRNRDSRHRPRVARRRAPADGPSAASSTTAPPSSACSCCSLIAALAIFGPILYGQDPDVTDLSERVHSRPNSAHPLGTDSLGRDLLARLLIAGRVSLSVGLAAALFATGIGLVVGLVAGTFGGWDRHDAHAPHGHRPRPAALIAVAVVVGIVGHGPGHHRPVHRRCSTGRRRPASSDRWCSRYASRTSCSRPARSAARTAGSSASTCSSMPWRR